LISEGLVLLNGVVETQKRKQLVFGDKVKANGHVIVVKLA
jgi:ribosome-associated protein YbcJ (S4-like RNA binding protein)